MGNQRLKENELKRQRLIKKMIRNSIIGFGIGVPLSFGLLYFHNVPAFVLIFTLGIPTLIAWAISHRPLQRLVDETYHELVEETANDFGVHYSKTVDAPPDYFIFHEFRLIPSSDRQAFRSLYTGERHGADFLLYEAHLEEEQTTVDSDGNVETRWVTVFHGEMFRLAWPRQFDGNTAIMRDAGIFNRMSRPVHGLQRVGLSSSEFEKAFEVWSNDQVEARDLLDPIIMERFIALESLFRGKGLRAVFHNGYLYITIRTGERLKRPSAYKSLTDGEFTDRIKMSFQGILDLIDVAIAPIEGVLSEAVRLEDVRSKEVP